MNDWNKQVLLRFSESDMDCWTVDDAMKGTSILGGTGSGKTSSSGKLIAKKFLQSGWGGLVLCAKNEEAKDWINYCINNNREYILFGKGSTNKKGKHLVFNPIDYEMTRPGEGKGEVQNLVNIFMNMYKMGNRIAGEGTSKDDRFWDSALKRCLSRALELLILADEPLTYMNMIKLMSTSDNISREISDQIYEIAQERRRNDVPDDVLFGTDFDDDENLCTYCLVNARVNLTDKNDQYLDDSKKNSYDLICSYFYETLSGMGEQVKATVIESFMALAEPFLSGILYTHFSGETNLKPETVFEDKKVVILNFPVKEFLDAGIMAQSVFKLMFQQAVERRNTTEHPTPCFLWADEAQYFINPYDQIFLTTARSSRTATVFLSQNISNYYSVLASGNNAKFKVDSFMGNLATKIFHANSDAETNEYASKLIGNTVQELARKSISQGMFNLDIKTDEGTNSQYLPQVQPTEFTTLKSGGVNHDFEVETYVFVTGKRWSNGKNHFKATFKQKFELTKQTA